MAQIGIIKIKKLIDGLLTFVKDDYDTQISHGYVGESFLERCFDDEDVTEGISYKTTAIEIFTRTPDKLRKVDTRIMFDIDRAPLPTIHLREPAKSKGKQDAISYIGEEFYENLDGSTNDQRRRSFTSNYELLITSMNRHEVIVMEEVMLALLIGAQDTLSLANPFYSFDFSVKELIAQNDLVPNPLFVKSISINASYDKTYPDLTDNHLLRKILFDQKILE